MTDPSPETRTALSPTALPIPDAARILAKISGLTISEEMLRDDLGLGAPTNEDGTLNLVHYVAWLLKENGRGD